MNYIGIDASLTGAGIVVIDQDANILHQGLISTSNDQVIEERMEIVVCKCLLIVGDYSPSVTCIESLSIGSRGQSFLDLAGLNFYLRIKLYLSKYTFYMIAPNQLKKFITGTGRCKKNLMLLKVYKKYGIEFSDDNLCDAYGLARFALENYSN